MTETSKSRRFLKHLHSVARLAFEKAGYRFERRRTGDLSLGVWRMHFGKAKPGSAPRRIVFVPGFGDTPLSWLGVLVMLQPVFRKRFDELVWLDFPGFAGALSDEKCFASIDLLHEACADLFDDLKPECILAHSLGGWVSARYAAECGEGARPRQKSRSYAGPSELILISPSGVFGSDNEKAEWEQVFRSSIEEGFSILRPRMFEKEPLWFRLVVPQFAGFTQREDVAAFMSSFTEDHRLDSRLGAVKSKVWLIWGNRDRLVPWGWHLAWLNGLKADPCSPRAVLLKGVGHSPQFETPGRLAWVLSQVLQGKLPGRVGARWWESVVPEGCEEAV